MVKKRIGSIIRGIFRKKTKKAQKDSSIKNRSNFGYVSEIKEGSGGAKRLTRNIKKERKGEPDFIKSLFTDKNNENYKRLSMKSPYRFHLRNDKFSNKLNHSKGMEYKEKGKSENRQNDSSKEKFMRQDRLKTIIKLRKVNEDAKTDYKKKFRSERLQKYLGKWGVQHSQDTENKQLIKRDVKPKLSRKFDGKPEKRKPSLDQNNRTLKNLNKPISLREGSMGLSRLGRRIDSIQKKGADVATKRTIAYKTASKLDDHQIRKTVRKTAELIGGKSLVDRADLPHKLSRHHTNKNKRLWDGKSEDRKNNFKNKFDNFERKSRMQMQSHNNKTKKRGQLDFRPENN